MDSPIDLDTYLGMQYVGLLPGHEICAQLHGGVLGHELLVRFPCVVIESIHGTSFTLNSIEDFDIV